ncbi:MAG: sigma 54-interacting transcriptional regulator [Myxococcota bacterium]
MAFLDSENRNFLRAISALAVSNPFLPERKSLEEQALGPHYVPTQRVWSLRGDPAAPDQNLQRIVVKLEGVIKTLRARMDRAPRPGTADLELYEDGVFFLLYHRHAADFASLMNAGARGEGVPARGHAEFQRELHTLKPDDVDFPRGYAPAHMFAFFFQLQRAFVNIFEHIVGGSLPAARLRAAVWQSVFTHQPRRYLDGLYPRMRDFTTLISGPSGSGKELVARAVGLSQYIPLDAKTGRFVVHPATSFHAVNLSALSPTLIESELFGHCRGAFTGAVRDRVGWLEEAGRHGSVFLDEIGELDLALQVKLLRVLQTRVFQRLGETEPRTFEGKLIVATNRHLPTAIDEGGFREDLYYRMCSDIITTPSLAEQLADSPDELRPMLLFIIRNILGGRGEADTARVEQVGDEVEGWIHERLGRAYPWPGNFRELEQCVRNVLIRRDYVPRPTRAPTSTTPALEETWRAIQQGTLSADELLTFYCTLQFARSGSYVETAQQVGLDRRTVKRHVDNALLQRLRASSG